MSSILGSPDMMLALARHAHREPRHIGFDPARGPDATIFGMRVQSSLFFPYRSECNKCAGTGEGIDSTFCPDCKGAGATKFEGMVRSGDQTTWIVGKLPRRFEPRPPSVPPAPMKGLV